MFSTFYVGYAKYKDKDVHVSPKSTPKNIYALKIPSYLQYTTAIFFYNVGLIS